MTNLSISRNNIIFFKLLFIKYWYIGLWFVSPLLQTCIWIILKKMNLSLCLHFFIYKRYSASDHLHKKEVIHFLTLLVKHYLYNRMKFTANLNELLSSPLSLYSLSTTIILKCILLNNWMRTSLSQYHIPTFIFSKLWRWKNGEGQSSLH